MTRLGALAAAARRRMAKSLRRSKVAEALEMRWRQEKVLSRSPFSNIYYCCTQKTASQWIRAVLSDPLVHRRCGLAVVPYRELGLKYAEAPSFPPQTIAAHLYFDYPTYAAIPKPERYRTFFVMRDPRDAVVSWYFSARYSHRMQDAIAQTRPALEQLTQHEGMRFMIDQLAEWGSFTAQRSWIEADDPAVRIFRFEDLSESTEGFVHSLLEYLLIPLTPREFDRLVQRHQYENYARGRQVGTENIASHYRKGMAGDWKNHFDDELIQHFRRVAGDDLVELLGYQW